MINKKQQFNKNPRHSSACSEKKKIELDLKELARGIGRLDRCEFEKGSDQALLFGRRQRAVHSRKAMNFTEGVKEKLQKTLDQRDEKDGEVEKT